MYHNAGLDGLSGGDAASYIIDDVNFRDRDTDANGSLEERVYYVQSWRHDLVALVTDTGELIEQVRYSSYGVPFGYPAGDTDSDGDWDATDSSTISFSVAYGVRKDPNLDGVIDASDITYANSITGGYQTLGWKVITSSAVNNFLGYAGYVYDAKISGGTQKYHVRYRVLDSELGRWLQRDPAGYVDGMSLYGTPRSLLYSDPTGLAQWRPWLIKPSADDNGMRPVTISYESKKQFAPDEGDRFFLRHTILGAPFHDNVRFLRWGYINNRPHTEPGVWGTTAFLQEGFIESPTSKILDWVDMDLRFAVWCDGIGRVTIDRPVPAEPSGTGFRTGRHKAGFNYEVIYSANQTIATLSFGMFSAYSKDPAGRGFSINAQVLGSGGGFGIQWTAQGQYFEYNKWEDDYKWGCRKELTGLEANWAPPFPATGVDGNGNSIPY